MICKLLLRAGLALVVLILPHQVAQAKPSISPAMQSSASDLIAEVNALRIANGLPPYTVNPILMQLAQDQANYMAATGQVGHRPGLTQRILAAGYPLAGDLSLGGFRAENVSGAGTAAQAVQRWTGDAPHLNTMLSPNLTEIGAGVAQVGGRSYMTILCAQPTTGGVPQAYTPNAEAVSTESFSPSEFIVPITVSTPDEAGMVYHDVQYGQSLWAIAIEYGVKIDEIRALNGLGDGIEIYQGDRLLIRTDAQAAAAIPSAEGATSTAAAPSRTSTPFPTATSPAVIATDPLAVAPETETSNAVAGIGIGVALAAILLAGILTWMSSRKPV